MRMGTVASTAFSIVIIARNEARNLPRLLDGLGTFADRGGEILVVDTGSIDDTPAIAQERGCRVESASSRFDSLLDVERATEIERRFAAEGEGPLVEAGQRLFHFGQAREYASQLASRRFVFQLDGGDEVLAFDIDAFENWIASGRATAFEYGQLFGNVSLRMARFYDRDRYHWEGRVHEMLSAVAAPGGASRLACDASHLLVRHHKDENKPRSYLAGLALQVIEAPQRPRWWHYLGRQLYYEGRYRSAIALLETHAAKEDVWSAERSQSLCYVGECYEGLGSDREAHEAYGRALALDSTRREPLLRLASLYSRRGEFEAAVQRARQSLAIPRTCAYPELEANYTWVPHSILYWSLFWLGRRDEARAHWEICHRLAPDEEIIRDHARLFPPASAVAMGAPVPPPSASGVNP